MLKILNYERLAVVAICCENKAPKIVEKCAPIEPLAIRPAGSRRFEKLHVMIATRSQAVRDVSTLLGVIGPKLRELGLAIGSHESKVFTPT